MQERKEQSLAQTIAQLLRGLSQQERNYYLPGDQRK